MEQEKVFEVLFMDEADEFISSLPIKVRKKVYFNIRKVAGGVRDSELFKKLDGSDNIWE